MGEEERWGGVPPGIGLVTILTVLLVLILTIFASLSLSTAQADYRLSRANADAVTAYYAADAQACLDEEAFAAGVEAQFEATYPMTEAQSLHIRLRRTEDGGVAREVWQTVSNTTTQTADPLPVWDGSSLPEA